MGRIKNVTRELISLALLVTCAACVGKPVTPQPTSTYTPRPSPTAIIKPSPTNISIPTATATPMPSLTPRPKYYLPPSDAIMSIIEIDGETYFILRGPSLTNRPTDYLGRNPCPTGFGYSESVGFFSTSYKCTKHDEPYENSGYAIDRFVDISFSHLDELFGGEAGLDMDLFGSVFWQDRESREILHSLHFSAELNPGCEIVGDVELKNCLGVPPGKYASEFVDPLLDTGKYLCKSLGEAGIIDWWLTHKSYVKSE